MFRKYCDDQRGTIAMLAALFLPVITLLFAMVLDLGFIAAKRAKIQAVTDFAAEAGATMIGDLIIEKAEAHNPPPDATNPVLYLTDDDRIAIASDPRVTQTIQTYVEKNRVGQQESPTITVFYPDNTIRCEGTADQKRIDLRLTIAEMFPTLFPNIFIGETRKTIRATAIQSVPICP